MNAAFNLKLFWNTKLLISVSMWSLKLEPGGMSNMNFFKKICSLLHTLSRLPIEVSDSRWVALYETGLWVSTGLNRGGTDC